MPTIRPHHATPGESPTPGWVRAALWFGLGAVSLYVAGWALAGGIREGYDPSQQAISELFEQGAPWPSRALVLSGLVLSGIAFLWLAPALHRALPGRGWVGPALVVVAGLGTLGVVAAPCSPGCPGAETSTTDTWHAITAGAGYTALVLAPLAFGWRVRAATPRLARWSALLGGTGLLLFVGYVLGVIEGAPGLQQRLFNTIADAWYVLVAIWVLRREGRPRRISANTVPSGPSGRGGRAGGSPGAGRSRIARRAPCRCRP